jgi:hypothetical protein
MKGVVLSWPQYGVTMGTLLDVHDHAVTAAKEFIVCHDCMIHLMHLPEKRVL